MGSYMGLAVPLYGDYKQYTSSACSTVVCVDVGTWGEEKRTVSIASTVAISSTQGGSANRIYGTQMIQMTEDVSSAAVGTVFTGQQVQLVANATNAGQAHQLYGQMVTFVQGASGYNYGGRVAVQQLAYQGISGYSPEAPAGQSFINFHTRAGHLANLFTCLTGAWQEVDHADEYFVTCVSAEADHALKIMVDNVQYYIMLANTTAA